MEAQGRVRDGGMASRTGISHITSTLGHNFRTLAGPAGPAECILRNSPFPHARRLLYPSDAHAMRALVGRSGRKGNRL